MRIIIVHLSLETLVRWVRLMRQKTNPLCLCPSSIRVSSSSEDVHRLVCVSLFDQFLESYSSTETLDFLSQVLPSTSFYKLSPLQKLFGFLSPVLPLESHPRRLHFNLPVTTARVNKNASTSRFPMTAQLIHMLSTRTIGRLATPV